MKKQLTFLVLLALLGAFLFLLEGCGDEPKPNPCRGIAPLDADFTIKQPISFAIANGRYDTLLATDTVLMGSTVQFEAKHDSMTYEWKIGEDDRTWNTKKVTLAFRDFYGSVRIRLIGRWSPNVQCFPKDDGVDTVYRTLTVLQDKDNPVFGEYEGYNLSKVSDIFRIKLSPTFPIYPWEGVLTNINKGCDGAGGPNGEYGWVAYRRYFFGWGDSTPFGGNCLAPKGALEVSGDGKNVRVNFSTITSTTNSKRVKDAFIGKRIN
ncbi:MAG: hypothetical protein JSU09_03715 [Bacteroidetes bacterium]|nr:hypothetical protein [Bacteroidota bacterium]